MQRSAASPGMARMLMEMLSQTDLRAVLPSIRVPTLVTHVTGDRLVPVELGREVAAMIEDNPEFDSQVSRIRTAAGAEAVELKDGKRLRFVARSSGSGRGFTLVERRSGGRSAAAFARGEAGAPGGHDEPGEAR